MSEQDDPALEAVDGVLKVLQVLVLRLGQSGVLDSSEYARDLLSYRTQEAPDSIQAAVIDRMLDMLVDRADVLLRRAEIHAVPPSPAGVGPHDEGEGRREAGPQAQGPGRAEAEAADPV